MLKIKDNVDLKKLEKFGFRNYPNCYEQWQKTSENSMSGGVVIRITNNRIVYPAIFEFHDTLYDLIKDGLVEKVGDSND